MQVFLEESGMSPSQAASGAQSLPTDVSLPDVEAQAGCWLAYSADGRRLLASKPTLKELEIQLRALGENPEEVILDHIPQGDAILSGAELS